MSLKIFGGTKIRSNAIGLVIAVGALQFVVSIVVAMETDVEPPPPRLVAPTFLKLKP